jgi:pimeloyl-ACP methyl ester carboxylesterase
MVMIEVERNAVTAEPKCTFVFVHGGNMSTDTWNKLARRDDYPPGGKLGGKVWNTVIPALKANNYRFFAPTLIDEYETNLTGHIDQICNIIIENDLKNVILVAHSYGGMIITGVADKIPDRISKMVYVDAALPDPGQSLFDIFSSGGKDPLSFVGLEPAPPYVEKLHFDARIIQKILKTYI